MSKATLSQKPQIIDVFSLFFYCLYQWKIIVAVAVVLAVWLGGSRTYNFYMVKDDKGMTGYDRELEKYEVLRGQYTHSMTAYELSFESHEAMIDTLNKEIEDAERLCAESPKMLLDPQAYYTETVRVYVDTDYKIIPEMTYQNINLTSAIVSSFVAELTSATVKSQLADACRFDALFVDDVYEVYAEEGCFVYIRLIGPSEEFIQNGIVYLENVIDDITNDIKVIMGDFDAYITDYGVALMSSQSMLNYQDEQKSQLVAKKTRLVKEKEDLAQLEEPEPFGESRPSVTGLALKSAVMGGCLGAFAMFVLYALTLIAGGRILSKRELCDGYGIKYVGRFCEKKYRGITKLLRRIQGKTNIENFEKDIAYVAGNILNYCQKCPGKILVTGSVKIENQNEFIDALSTLIPEDRIVWGNSLLEDANSLRVINECSAVVLVEKCYKSKYTNIGQELIIIDNLEKEIVGVVIVE